MSVGRPVLLVVGAGPGLGAAVAASFLADGYDVRLVARSPNSLRRLTRVLDAEAGRLDWATADITDPAALGEAVEELLAPVGRLDVLHFNPSRFRHRDPLTLQASELLEDVHVGAAALLTATQAAAPYLRPGARVVATGSMAADQPWHEACSLGVQKAALRNLVRSLDAALRPRGVRATSVTVRGTLAPGTPFSTELVAEAIRRAATAPEEDWRTEVVYEGAVMP